MNDFGEPELLDDIVDHWSASIHVAEKAALLTRLRNLAKATNTRITLMSGDVHQCIYCFTSSTKEYTQLAADPGFMPQVRQPPCVCVHGIVPPSSSLVQSGWQGCRQ
jgi:PhoD related phosphatase